MSLKGINWTYIDKVEQNGIKWGIMEGLNYTYINLSIYL